MDVGGIGLGWVPRCPFETYLFNHAKLEKKALGCACGPKAPSRLRLLCLGCVVISGISLRRAIRTTLHRLYTSSVCVVPPGPPTIAPTCHQSASRHPFHPSSLIRVLCLHLAVRSTHHRSYVSPVSVPSFFPPLLAPTFHQSASRHPFYPSSIVLVLCLHLAALQVNAQ